MSVDAKSREIPAAPVDPRADRIDPLAMTVAQAAKVLSAVGVGTVTEELIRRHVAAGAPATADGRINLVHYAAWLNLTADPSAVASAEPEGSGQPGKHPAGACEHAP
jgi:hypothetical protein